MQGHSSCVYTQPYQIQYPRKNESWIQTTMSFTLFSLCYPLRLVGYIFDQHNLHFQPIILVLCRYSLKEYCYTFNIPTTIFCFVWSSLVAFGILVPQLGVERCPQQWKHEVLTTDGHGFPHNFFFNNQWSCLLTPKIISYQHWICTHYANFRPRDIFSHKQMHKSEPEKQFFYLTI